MESSHLNFEYWMPEKGIDDPCLRGLLDFWFNGGLDVFDISNSDHLLKLIRELNIQPVIYNFLRQRNNNLFIDQKWANTLRIEALQLAGTCAYRQHIIEILSKQFDRAGIKPIWLKGPSLAYTVYPRPEWRTYKDFDLLIAPSDWDAAIHVMKNAGYDSSYCLNWGFLSFEKSFRPMVHIPGSVDVELHYKLSNRPQLSIFSFDELIEDSMDLSNFPFPFVVPHPVKHFIFVCLHRIGHHPNDRRFTWLLDMMYLIEHFNDDDWNKVIEYSSSKKISKILLKNLSEIQKIFPISVPKLVTRELMKQSESCSEPSEVFLSLRRNKWIDLWTRWWDMPGLTIKLKYLLHWAIPPKSYMNDSVGKNPFLIQHKDRFVKGLKKYFGGEQDRYDG